MADKLKLRLTVDVEYELDGENPQELKANLEGLVKIGMGDALLTGDGPATIEDYSYKVEEV